MKPTVYIETSVISYLTSNPNRDIIIAAHQQITSDWWEYRREEFELFTSQLVFTEAGKGDEKAAAKRLNILQGIPLLEFKTEVYDLASIFIRQKAISKKMEEDVLHIAIAVVYGLNYSYRRHTRNRHLFQVH